MQSLRLQPDPLNQSLHLKTDSWVICTHAEISVNYQRQLRVAPAMKPLQLQSLQDSSTEGKLILTPRVRVPRVRSSKHITR